MSANFRAGEMVQLDRRPEPDEQVTAEAAKDSARLARGLMGILRHVALLRRRWSPRRIDFEGVHLDATGTAQFTLPHSFGGRVRYWVVEWVGAAAPNIRRHAASTPDVLFLTSTSDGVATVRVEEAG